MEEPNLPAKLPRLPSTQTLMRTRNLLRSQTMALQHLPDHGHICLGQQMNQLTRNNQWSGRNNRNLIPHGPGTSAKKEEMKWATTCPPRRKSIIDIFPLGPHKLAGHSATRSRPAQVYSVFENSRWPRLYATWTRGINVMSTSVKFEASLLPRICLFIIDFYGHAGIQTRPCTARPNRLNCFCREANQLLPRLSPQPQLKRDVPIFALSTSQLPVCT